MAPALKVAAGTADVWSVQVTSDAGIQSSTGGGGARQEEESEGAKFAPGSGSQGPVTLADAAAVSARNQAIDNVMMEVNVMMEKLKT